MADLIERLKTMASKKPVAQLALETGINRQHIYRLLRGENSPSLQITEKIARALGCEISLSQTESSDQLLAELATIGAPISSDPTLAKRKSPNSILRAALQEGRKSPTINSILPVTLFKNKTLLDWEFIFETEESFYLGYILDMILQAKDDPEIRELKSRISLPSTDLQTVPLIDNSPSERKLALMKYKQNYIAKRWGFLTLDTIDSNTARMKKWLREI